ncbi:MAG: glutaredoxin family protein [Candidatus Woesearchaeota archaeon]
MVEKRRILIQIPTCPYCQNARTHLDETNIEYDIVDIDPQDRSLVETLSGQPSVPIFVEVVGMKDQDDDIIAYIEELQKKQNES